MSIRPNEFVPCPKGWGTAIVEGMVREDSIIPSMPHFLKEDRHRVEGRRSHWGPLAKSPTPLLRPVKGLAAPWSGPLLDATSFPCKQSGLEMCRIL